MKLGWYDYEYVVWSGDTGREVDRFDDLKDAEQVADFMEDKFQTPYYIRTETI